MRFALLALALLSFAPSADAGMLRYLQQGDRFTVNDSSERGGTVTAPCQITPGNPESSGRPINIPQDGVSIEDVRFRCDLELRISYTQGGAGVPRVRVVNRQSGRD